jgi:tellurium resistance protein TerD
MDFAIVEKGQTLEIKDKAGKALTNVYLGAGWDFVGSPVDLDLVAAALDANGKLTAQTRLVYFGDRAEPGIQLSEDNRTGEGDGDDESIVFKLSEVEADVHKIAFGIVAYAGADLSTAKNVHFRVVDGADANGTQVLDVPVSAATSGQTVLHAGNIVRDGASWKIENVSAFYARGNGGDAVKGFASLFT